MKRRIHKIIFIFILLILIFTCCSKKEMYLKKYMDDASDSPSFQLNDYQKLFRVNKINLKNNYPFYIIRLKAPLYLSKPDNNIIDNCIMLKFGDIVFPVKELKTYKDYFYVKTVDNKYGWINSGFGISINYDEDAELDFFSDKKSYYYLQRYKDATDDGDKAARAILALNVVPLLLGNYKSEGWFYPDDYNLALDISKLTVDLTKNDERYYFFGAITFSYWRADEIVLSYNLLADSYQKLKFYDKAEEIHEMLIRRYFWKKSYNSEIGGLTSYIKLEHIYLEQLNNEVKDSIEYLKIKKKILNNILKITSDKNYVMWTAKDVHWSGLTFTEWMIEILRKNLTSEEYYEFCDDLSRMTDSDGFKDFLSFFKAIEMLREGKNKKYALHVLQSYKPKSKHKPVLRIDDWLSANNLVPDSDLYKYK